MLRSGRVLLALVTLLCTSAAAPAGIEPLIAYAGKWRLEVHSLPTLYSKAGTSRLTIVNRCLVFMQHLACGQNVDGRDSGMIIFSYDAASGRYASLIVSADGTGQPGRLERDGDLWIFPWDEQHGGQTVHMRVTNRFVGPNEIAYSKDFSNDGRIWTNLETGREQRA